MSKKTSPNGGSPKRSGTKKRTRAIELYAIDSPFGHKVIDDKRKKPPKHKKRIDDETI